MTKKRELAKNTLIIAFGKVSTQLITFLLLPLYTTFLSPGEYGTVDLIMTYIILLVPAITIQLEMAAFRFLIDARNDEAYKKQIISNIFYVVGLIVLVCVGLYFILNVFIDIPYAKLILINIVAMLLANLFLQIARGVGSNMKFAIGCILASIATLISGVVFVGILGLGADGMLMAAAMSNSVCTLYLFFALKLYKYMSLRSDKPLQKELIQYSFPLVPNGISWWVINVSDRTIISIVIGVAANGIYAVANRYAAIFTSLSGIFAMSWAESASMHIDSKDRNSFFSDTINASVRLFGSLGLVLIAGIPLVFSLLIDAQFNEAYLYIPVLIVAAFFNAIVGLYSAIYIAKKMTKQVANTSMIAAVINLGLTLILMHFIGLWAAAVATAIAYLAMAIYRHYDVKKYVTITYKKNIFAILITVYIVAMGLYYINTIWGNIANVLFVMIVTLLLNKSMIKVIQNKVFSIARKRKELVEQPIYKDMP